MGSGGASVDVLVRSSYAVRLEEGVYKKTDHACCGDDSHSQARDSQQHVYVNPV